MVDQIPKFFKIRRVKISYRPPRKYNVAVVGCGNLGCENAIKSVQIKKQIGERAGSLVLMHADTNLLMDAGKRASKFISKDRIFPVQINHLQGNGNGKSPKECIENFESWRKEFDRQEPKIIAQAGKAGSWCAEYHTGSGGSYPAIIYAMKKLENIFYRKLVVVGQATDPSSEKNMPELLSGLKEFDESYKVIFANNLEEDQKGQNVDFGNMAFVSATTLGTEKMDATDFLGENGLSKFMRLQIGFGVIPYDGLIFKVQNYEKTLKTCVNLVQSLKMQKSNIAILIGNINHEIRKTAIGMAYGTAKPECYLKIIGVRIDTWNIICGRLTAFEPEKVPTPNFDDLAKRMGLEKW